MNLFALSLKSLRRRKLRTALTVAGVAIAAATLFSLISFNQGFERSLKEEMNQSGIHMLVSTEGCPMEAASLALHGGEIPKFLDEKYLPQIKGVGGVDVAAGMLIFSLIEDTGKALYFYGVTDDFIKLKPHWKLQGEWFTGPDSIVLGVEAANVEKRKPGDKIFFPDLNREFTVSGVLERTGSEDDGFFFMPLETAQQVFKKEGKLTGIAVSLQDVGQYVDVKSEIETFPDIYVVSRDQMMEQIMTLTGSSKTLMTAVMAIAIIVSLLGVINTVLMSVFEMQKEFGYMRCVGASRRHIFQLVFYETLVICALGGVVGVTLGLAFASATDHWLHEILPYAPAGRYITLDPSIVGLVIGLSVIAGVVSGIIPGWKASQSSPMEAVRHG